MSCNCYGNCHCGCSSVERGPQGIMGLTGAQGVPGTNGINGEPGEPGPAGPAGPATNNVIPLFDSFVDVSTPGLNLGNETLYTNSIPAGQLANNGDKIFFEYTTSISDFLTGTTLFFGGTQVGVLDAGFANLGGDNNYISFEGHIIRVSSSIVRVVLQMLPVGGSIYPIFKYLEITGLNLANAQAIELVTSGTAVLTGYMASIWYQKGA